MGRLTLFYIIIFCVLIGIALGAALLLFFYGFSIQQRITLMYASSACVVWGGGGALYLYSHKEAQ